MAGRPKKQVQVTEDKEQEIVVNNENTKDDSEKVSNVEVNKRTEATIKNNVKQKRDLQEMVCVRNATRGKLVYVSKKSMGYEVVWQNFGDEEYLTLEELVAMRNSYNRFFKDTWVVIDDYEIIQYLNLEKFYKDIIDIDDFDSLFYKSPSELKEALEKTPKTLRDTIVQRAKELIESKELDSMQRIEVIENVLNVDLRL